MSRALLPLVPLYAAAVAAKNLAWDRRWIKSNRLQGPVISIGNLSVGGSGKTPLVIRLAELLSQRGIAVDVLSRGYGRHSTSALRVQPGGAVEQYGDEPLLIAQAAGVPVYVAADRYQAGLLAESQPGNPKLHLLDDGFQHRQLARNVDIVVLHRGDFSEQLLPAGRLREGFSSLRRAQILVLRAEDRDLEPDLRRRGCNQLIWWMERRLEISAPRPVVAFCAIARPEEFASVLRREGCAVAALRAWRDHHRFTHADLAELIELRRQHEAEAFVTTEKDLVRLSPEQRGMLESAAPLEGARLLVRLDDEAAAIDRLLQFLSANWPQWMDGQRNAP